jgi:hypothetical protein
MSFIVKGQDGTTIAKNAYANNLLHDVAILAAGATGGTLTIRGKKPGSQFFEEIPDGTIDLSSAESVQFTGAVQEYEFTLESFAGTGDIRITDTSQRS